MSKRNYTHFRELEPQIIAMREEGMSRTQIAEELGLTWKQVDNWVARYNKRMSTLASGMPSKRKGRPRTRPLTRTEEYERQLYRNDRNTIIKEDMKGIMKGKDEAKNAIKMLNSAWGIIHKKNHALLSRV